MQIAPSTCEGVQVVTVPVLLDRCKILATFFNGELFPQGYNFEQGQISMATKQRVAAMAASLCAVCSGPMVIKLVTADPSNGASELRTYVCGGCGHTRTYSVAAGNS